MSRPLPARLVQRWLLALLALVTLQTLWIHLMPPRVRAAAVEAKGLPGEPLAPLPGWSGDMQAGSLSLLRQLPGGRLLLLTSLASGTIEGFQVASLTRATPALRLQQRRLSTTPLGQIAAGGLQGRPAAQTCLVGSRGAITGEALHALVPRERQFSSQWFATVLGFRPAPILRCTLVTLLASEPTSPSSGAPPADLVAELGELLPGLTLR